MNGKGPLLWIAGFAGVFLLYSAYKGESPLSVLNSYQGKGGADLNSSGSTPATTVPDPGTATNNDPAFVVDVNGLSDTAVPDAYSNTPGSYIPGNS